MRCVSRQKQKIFKRGFFAAPYLSCHRIVLVTKPNSFEHVLQRITHTTQPGAQYTAMGIRDLSKLIDRYARKSSRPVTLADARGTRWAVDANIFMYRFMAAKPHYEGRHVERFRKFVLWMQACGIEPLFVFDGDSPEEKKRELKTRREQKKKATSNLRDLQQGVVVLHHLDWRWVQLETVLRAVALLCTDNVGTAEKNSSREREHSEHCDGNVNKDASFVFDALFQLIAEVLEWATETYLPTRLMQEHVDRSGFLHDIPIATLPSLVRFMAFVRLRRHTPHMVELDWMHDPALASLGMFDTPTNDVDNNSSDDVGLTGETDSKRNLKGQFQSTEPRKIGSVATGPIVLIGGGDMDDLAADANSVNIDDNNTDNSGATSRHRSDDYDGRTQRISASTKAACTHNVAADTLERLLVSALASKRDVRPLSKVPPDANDNCAGSIPPFVLCVHCTHSIAKNLNITIAKYRRSVEKAWKCFSRHAMLVAVIAHKDANSDGEWLLPSPTNAEIRIREWQSSLHWPTKCQEKAATGANFDYYDWICSARSSAWWFDMQETSTECTRMRFSDTPSTVTASSSSSASVTDAGAYAWQDESLDGDALAHALWSRLWLPREQHSTTVCSRSVCLNRCDLYTRAAATLLNRQLDEQNEPRNTKESDPAIEEDRSEMEKKWDTFRSEQQRKKEHCAKSTRSGGSSSNSTSVPFANNHQHRRERKQEKRAAEEPEGATKAAVAEANDETAKAEKEPSSLSAGGGKNTCRPKKQRLACLESPNQRSLLAKRMQKQIASLEPQVTRVTSEQLEQVQELLRSMSVLSLTAEHEAEATCARLCRAGYSDWVVTEDFDALPFGAPYMFRRLRWTDIVLTNERIPDSPLLSDADRKYNTSLAPTTVIGELIDFRVVLKQLRMTPLEFIDLCILCGCDFCSSLSGVGFSAARDLVLRYGCIENVVDRLDPTSRYGKGLHRFSIERAQRARELFLENHNNALPESVLSQMSG